MAALTSPTAIDLSAELETTPDKVNHARVCRLLIQGGTKVAREIFDRIHPPATLAGKLADPQTKQDFKKLKGRVIKTKEWNLLYPKPSNMVSSEHFDITLFMILFRNICNLPDPTTGWDRHPASSDHSQGADLVRIKTYRNELQHSHCASLSDKQFEIFWKKVSTVLVRLGVEEEVVDGLKSESMDCGETERHMKVMAEWEQSDCDVKECLLRIEENQHDQDSKLDRIERNQGHQVTTLEELSQNQQRQDEKLDKIMQLQSTGMAGIAKEFSDFQTMQQEQPKVAVYAFGKPIHYPSQMQCDVRQTIEQQTSLIYDVRGLKQQSEIQHSGQMIDQQLLERRSILNVPEESSTPGVAEDEFQHSALKCRKILADYYRHQMSKVTPLPWCDDTLKLNDIYTNPTFVTENGKPLIDGDLFTITDGSSTAKRLLIEGDPGYGKSTFCLKLAYDWALGQSRSLEKMMLVFVIELRRLSGKVKDEIFNYLVPQDSEIDKDDLWQYISKHQSQVCFIFDGFDEMPQNVDSDIIKLIEGRILRDSHVILTSRKIRGAKAKIKKYFDRFAYIQGFTAANFNAFIRRHFRILQQDSEGRRLIKEVEASEERQSLLKLVESPLNALLLCAVWEKYQNLPEKRTELYDKIVTLIATRYCENNEIEDDEAAEIPEKIEHQLNFLGNLSLKAFKNGTHRFTRKELKLKSNPDLLEMGFLSKYVSERILLSAPTFVIHHSTFQEFLAAKYIAMLHESCPVEFEKAIRDLHSNPDVHGPVLTFLAGLLNEEADAMFQAFTNINSPIKFAEVVHYLEEAGHSPNLVSTCASFLSLSKSINVEVGTPLDREIRIMQELFQNPSFQTEKVSLIFLYPETLPQFRPVLNTLASVHPETKLCVSFGEMWKTEMYKIEEEGDVKSRPFSLPSERAPRLIQTSQDMTTRKSSLVRGDTFADVYPILKRTNTLNKVQTFGVQLNSIKYTQLKAILECIERAASVENLLLGFQYPFDELLFCWTNSSAAGLRALEDLFQKYRFRVFRLTCKGNSFMLNCNRVSHLEDRNVNPVPVLEFINYPVLCPRSLLEFIHCYEGIQSLILSNCSLSHTLYVHLCKFLRDKAYLTTLGLDFPINEDEISTHVFTEFLEHVSSIRHLANLSIKGWKFSKSETFSIWADLWCHLLSQIKHLQVIDLSFCLPMMQNVKTVEINPLIKGVGQFIRNCDDIGIECIHLEQNVLSYGDVLELQRSGALYTNKMSIYGCTCSFESSKLLQYCRDADSLKVVDE